MEILGWALLYRTIKQDTGIFLKENPKYLYESLCVYLFRDSVSPRWDIPCFLWGRVLSLSEKKRSLLLIPLFLAPQSIFAFPCDWSFCNFVFAENKTVVSGRSQGRPIPDWDDKRNDLETDFGHCPIHSCLLWDLRIVTLSEVL